MGWGHVGVFGVGSLSDCMRTDVRIVGLVCWGRRLGERRGGGAAMGAGGSIEQRTLPARELGAPLASMTGEMRNGDVYSEIRHQQASLRTGVGWSETASGYPPR